MRRLKIMVSQQQQHFTLFPVASQQVHVAFDGGRIVSDAGLLAVRALEKPLRVIADLAQRLPDPPNTSNTPPKHYSPKPSTRSSPAIPTGTMPSNSATIPSFKSSPMSPPMPITPWPA